MNRRNFLRVSPIASAPSFAFGGGDATPVPQSTAFQGEKSSLKITGIKIVQARPRTPLPASFRYTIVHEPWAENDAPKTTLMSPYRAEHQGSGTRHTEIFDPLTNNRHWPFGAGIGLQVTTDKGVTGLGHTLGGEAADRVATSLAPLLIGEDPFNVEKLWDIMWRSTLYYGRKGIAIQAISGIDLALWDLVGKAAGLPVYKLLGGETKPRIPGYATLNDVHHHAKFGFKKLKLALPYGPMDGREGLKKNVDVVRQTRELLGPDGEIMLDCIMALTERYTIELAEAMEPYRISWIEEPLIPEDYEGFGRLNDQIRSTRIATGEHEYTRYGFRRLLEQHCAKVWQPDIHWCGGMTEIRRIAALASAYDIPVNAHIGGTTLPGMHFMMATVNAFLAEMVMPPPGGPPEVYRQYEEDLLITRGPGGIYNRPPDRPGFGYDVVVS
jgi:L-rhamnonate dehydratase